MQTFPIHEYSSVHFVDAYSLRVYFRKGDLIEVTSNKCTLENVSWQLAESVLIVSRQTDERVYICGDCVVFDAIAARTQQSSAFSWTDRLINFQSSRTHVQTAFRRKPLYIRVARVSS